MRYPAAEKLEIIRLVEQSHLPTRQTLDKLEIPRRTFARWYARYLDGGPEALEDKPSAPSRVWNRLGNVTPADAYFGRDRQIHAQRAAIKKQTIEHRRLQHRKLAA
jgi:transposase-like protein